MCFFVSTYLTMVQSSESLPVEISTAPPPKSASICVSWAAVLASGLFIVARLTETLPVLLVPEQCHVAAMRSYVVNHCCLCVFAMSHALHAKRMFFEECFACWPPSAVVASLACRTGSFGMHTQMFPAILITYQSCAAGMPTRFLWSVWHSLSLHEKGRSAQERPLYIFLSSILYHEDNSVIKMNYYWTNTELPLSNFNILSSSYILSIHNLRSAHLVPRVLFLYSSGDNPLYFLNSLLKW